MFDYLKDIDRCLYERYLTLERNIKSRSNSFYDSYLDLQENFIKLALRNVAIDIKAQETCGAILRRQEVENYFKCELFLDDYTYNKMKDYTLKVNSHKHKGEKKIQIETIINYLKVFYDASTKYARESAHKEFDAEYFISIYGIFEKENADLKNEVELLKEELFESVEAGKLKDSDIHAYKSMISKSEIEKLTLEEQNSELQRQISKLKDIKLASMEDKLNRTIEMLLNLQDAVVENRVVSYAVGDALCGREILEKRIEKAKKDFNDGK